MIRVTYKEYEKVYTKNVLYIRNADNRFFMTYRYDYEETDERLLSKSKIIKIEKQVKDLTLEEIEKLGCEFERLYPREWRYKAQYLINNENYFESDFIDITAIVKGE